MAIKKELKLKLVISIIILISISVLIIIFVNAESLGLQPFISNILDKNKGLTGKLNLGLGKEIPIIINEKINIDILSPKSEAYTNNKINIEVKSSYKCNLEYADIKINITGNLPTEISESNIPDNQFKELCYDCNHINQSKLLEDGTHYFYVRCKEDKNADSFTIFSIDGKAPKIKSIYPKENSYINGEGFIVEYNEDNIVYSILKIKELCEEPFQCEEQQYVQECPDERSTRCSFDTIDLKKLDGKDVEYSIVITDLGDRSIESQKIKATVDATPPKILSFNILEEENKITFDIEVDENNLEKIEYIDNHEASPVWKSLCISKNKKCKITKTIQPGTHYFSIRAVDKAGNVAVSSNPTRL